MLANLGEGSAEGWKKVQFSLDACFKKGGSEKSWLGLMQSIEILSLIFVIPLTESRLSYSGFLTVKSFHGHVSF